MQGGKIWFSNITLYLVKNKVCNSCGLNCKCDHNSFLEKNN